MKTLPWLVTLVLVGTVVRVLLLGSYEPLATLDSSTYVTAARDLISRDFTMGQGRRTPGYPLLIALVGEDPRHIALAQMCAGLAVSVLLFWIALVMTGIRWLAFAVGMSYSLNLQQVFLEATLMTEPLTTTMVVATVAVLLPALRRLRQGEGATGLLLLTGTLAAATILVRPQFIFLPVLLPVLLIYAVNGFKLPGTRAIGKTAFVVLPSVLAVFGWASVVYTKTGYFTMSTQSGLGLVNHSVNFIELAPEPYAKVREILLKYRAERIAASGHAGNTIWYALPEIREATGWTLPEASRQVQKMSMQMFAEHPLIYAESVAHPWLEFWTVPIIWAPERISPAWLAQPLEAIWWVQHKLLRLSNLLFVLLVAGVVLSRSLRKAVRWDLDVTAISALILASSLLQAMADRGAGSRYAMTVQALVVLVLLVCVVRLRFVPQAEPIAEATPVRAPQ